LQQHLPLLQQHYSGLSWSACGVLQMGKGAAAERMQRQTVFALQHPQHHLQYLDQAQAGERSGVAVAAGGWWFSDAGWIRPPSLCQALLARAHENIEYHWRTKATSLQQTESGWRVTDAAGHLIAEASVVVIANAADAVSLLPQMRLPLSWIRGQISYLPQGELPTFHSVLCRDGYVLPAIEGKHVLGASYDFGVMETDLLDSAHQGNMQRLADILPEAARHVDTALSQGRVGFRCVSSDRMPLVGALPDMLPLHVDAGTALSRLPRSDGLYCLLGLGSRGLVWSGIAAELLANQICGEPWRLERDLAEALDPARFWLRELRRGKATA
jgi:tRNA 5-methylaminomethyl-2-thiouridine biosynthesis bifunctional protein